MYSSTTVQFRLLGYSSGRAIIGDTILPNPNACHDKLLREFQNTTIPEMTTFAARASSTRRLGDANLFRDCMCMRAQTAGEKQGHIRYFTTAYCNSSTRTTLQNQHNTQFVVDEGWVDRVDDAQENADLPDCTRHQALLAPWHSLTSVHPTFIHP